MRTGGRFGQTAAQMLMAKRVPITLIDKKPEQIELAGEFGTKVYYGDGLRLDLLRSAGAETATAILFCNDNRDGELTREALKQVLEAFPQAAVLVRTFDRLHLIELEGLDLAFAQRELFESAVAMGRAALKAVGEPVMEVDRVESEYRMRDCERLELQRRFLAKALDRAARFHKALHNGDPEEEARKISYVVMGATCEPTPRRVRRILF